jgi:hypothetical protein
LKIEESRGSGPFVIITTITTLGGTIWPYINKEEMIKGKREGKRRLELFERKGIRILFSDSRYGRDVDGEIESLKSQQNMLPFLLFLPTLAFGAAPSLWPLPQAMQHGDDVMPLGPDVLLCFGEVGEDCKELPNDIQDGWVS